MMIKLIKSNTGDVQVTSANSTKVFVCKYDKTKDEYKIPKDAGFVRKTIRTSNLKWDADGKCSIEDTKPVTYVRSTSPKVTVKWKEGTPDEYKDRWELAALKYRIDMIEIGGNIPTPTIESVFKKDADAVKKFIQSPEDEKLAEYKKQLAELEAKLAKPTEKKDKANKPSSKK